MALKFQGGRATEAAPGIINEAERASFTSAMRSATESLDHLKNANAQATKSGSTKRPNLYQRAMNALNTAKEAIDAARSSNGR